MINYFLNTDAGGQAKIVVSDPARQIVRQVDGPAKRGLNRALVSLAGGGGRGAGGAQGQRGRGAAATPPLAVGDYTVTVDVAGVTMTKGARGRARIQ